jgi:hypothetical protein
MGVEDLLDALVIVRNGGMERLNEPSVHRPAFETLSELRTSVCA